MRVSPHTAFHHYERIVRLVRISKLKKLVLLLDSFCVFLVNLKYSKYKCKSVAPTCVDTLEIKGGKLYCIDRQEATGRC